MKKTFLLISFLGTAILTHAQISKGSWMVGGTAAYSSTMEGDIHNTILDVSPRVGYFLMKNLAVGVNVAFNQTSDDGESYSTVIAGPYARYYFLANNEKVKLFANANAFLGTEDEGKGSSNLTGFGVAAGANYFLNKFIALEASLGYYSTQAKIESVKDNTIGLNFGFQLFFNRE
jgi:hypothetical protein